MAAENPSPRQCITCLRRIEADAQICTHCGTDQRTGQQHQVIVARDVPGAPPAGAAPDTAEDIGLRWSPWLLVHWIPVMLAQIAGVIVFFLMARSDKSLQASYKSFAAWYLGIALVLVVIDALVNADWGNLIETIPIYRGVPAIGARNPYFIGALVCAFGACMLIGAL